MASFLNRNGEHDPPIGEVPVPHSQDAGLTGENGAETKQSPLADTGFATEQEKEIFAHLVRPDDSYTPEGVYWADLPLGQRVSFVSSVDAAESKAELASLGAMIKKNPFSPIAWYWRNGILPGAGLGLEGYVLFSIGNLSTLFGDVWTGCWGKDATTCNPNWIAAVTYLEIVGIMFGQVGVGIVGDWIGRRWGLIQDAAIMLLGLIMLVASWGTTLENWVILYAWCLFIYGVGVGGEYPITATSSMENAVTAGKLSTRDDRLHRGRKVTMAFLMQGWGQVLNQVVLIILLLILNRGQGDAPYTKVTAQYVYRLSFAIPALGTAWLVYYRTFKMKHSNSRLNKAKSKNNVTGYDVRSLKLTINNFGGRLLATSIGWFCNDVFFYGNKLFASSFIKVVADNPDSILVSWEWSLINTVVALAGYYCACLLVDNKLYGRKMMQQVGFIVCFITFVIPAFNYSYYTSSAGIHSFQAMYFLSSFFNQFGPNSITFLVAGEVFPTQVRASAHGFSAMIGKSGALLASVLYNYIDSEKRFHVVPWFGLAGMLVTYIWLPDTTGLDLKEQERRWQYMLEGREHEYHGIAIHPKHLSLWERMRGVGKSYHPDMDMKAKIHDLHAEWEEREAARHSNDPTADLDDDFTEEIDNYFRGKPSNHYDTLKGEKMKVTDGSLTASQD
ncbi:major facilitator superfamily domain-containing protein [Xylariaceae sp. FL0804]|nr:major facilitator superfamily domain-containing protein [Xylariaceae sp. FL0804]